MDLTSLESFLTSAKNSVDTAITNNLGDTYVVLGNEAADLDSVVSSIVTSYYTALSLSKEEKENKSGDQQSFVFPVINCTREDLPLRTEVTYFLTANNISLDSLICKDEIDLQALQAGGRLKLTLVDHNMLATADAHLQPSVIRVIDHHKRDKPLDRRDIIEPVGSCSTLVAEMALGLFDTNEVICQLLYGTILLDTINLSETAQRATPKDVKIISELEEYLHRISGKAPCRDTVYNPIVKARSDISHLTPEQLLRKDCKLLKTPEITVAIPAVPLMSQKFLELPGATDALRNFLRINRCSAIVVMGWEVIDSNSMQRDITVFSDSIHKAKQLVSPLESCSDLQLQVIKNVSEAQCVYWIYEQKNVTLSRKFILPFLANHFEAKAQSQLDVDALAGVEILMPNGEMSPVRPSTAIPSISYSSAQNLGIGDPISQGGSSQSSAYNSCPYTPQNSCAEPEDGFPLEHYFLPSFNSREMIEKIESKRHKLRGYDKSEDELKPGGCSSYPFTPKNSYVDSNFESAYGDKHFEMRGGGPVAGILNSLDSDVLMKKLMEKRKEPSSMNNSSSSSKSQSMTRLPVEDNLSGSGEPQLSPQFTVTPPIPVVGSNTPTTPDRDGKE